MRNIWETDKAMIGTGYCLNCEREFPFHYDTCPGADYVLTENEIDAMFDTLFAY